MIRSAPKSTSEIAMQANDGGQDIGAKNVQHWDSTILVHVSLWLSAAHKNKFKKQ